MSLWIVSTVGLLVAYLLGSIPTAFLAGKLLKNIDIREHGSKSVGATNALRVLGKWPGLAVLLIDLLKGAVAIIFVRWLFAWSGALPSTETSTEMASEVWLPWIVCLAGLAALLGHSRSIWLKFAGGKSAATGLGILLAISWPVGLSAAAVFGLVLAVSRIVSLSSILAALTAGTLVFGLEHSLPYQLLVGAGCLYVIVRHRSNIQRLASGTEPRIGQSAQ
ncbi:MAG: glycerol-3-phosphate 1-O-acyltransferase PlsY [Parvibaculaceae bacterium]|nr:glycerol-3-phosphate 1-O-acyltransferase PlsY [Parvibaculaceae bacterium]HBM88191.1 glycerol-3-phosphate acyltransferase [Rhodobiaceae bacterium]|tara:strand:- start:154 stop:816 length:663 start_codon:yes stop_codon:yes gene_type:complete